MCAGGACGLAQPRTTLWPASTPHAGDWCWYRSRGCWPAIFLALLVHDPERQIRADPGVWWLIGGAPRPGAGAPFHLCSTRALGQRSGKGASPTATAAYAAQPNSPLPAADLVVQTGHRNIWVPPVQVGREREVRRSTHTPETRDVLFPAAVSGKLQPRTNGGPGPEFGGSASCGN